MPRFAATLASLLLIASSIGVNIARYPRIGRAIDPTPAGAAEMRNPSQAASEFPLVEKPETEQLRANSEVAAPTVREQRPDATNTETIVDRMAAVAPQPTVAQKDVGVAIVDVRPMISVGDAQVSSVESPANASRFQRLPPIESGGRFPDDTDAWLNSGNYLTTGTP